MRIEIRGHGLPGRACAGYAEVAVGVQRGREVVDAHPADADAVVWAFDVTPVRAGCGAAGGRRPAGPARPGMFRRAKLMLDPVMLAEAALSGTGTLVADLGLTMADGTPLCAAVRAPVVAWSVRAAS